MSRRVYLLHGIRIEHCPAEFGGKHACLLQDEHTVKRRARRLKHGLESFSFGFDCVARGRDLVSSSVTDRTKFFDNLHWHCDRK